MAASDTLAEIHLEMSALDTDLEDLRDSVKSINKTYATVEDSLQMKWKQIRKLETTERDLNKLQYLSELPNMFKDALTKFQNAADRDKDVNVFAEPVQYYSDYSDILTNYKQTKFMISLYGEIKSFRVATGLNCRMNPFQGFFVLALACCCLLNEVSAAPVPIIDPLSATIGAAGAVC